MTTNQKEGNLSLKPVHTAISNETLSPHAKNRRLFFYLLFRLSLLLLFLYPSLQCRKLSLAMNPETVGRSSTFWVCSQMVLIINGIAKSMRFARQPSSRTTSGLTRSAQLLSVHVEEEWIREKHSGKCFLVSSIHKVSQQIFCDLRIARSLRCFNCIFVKFVLEEQVDWVLIIAFVLGISFRLRKEINTRIWSWAAILRNSNNSCFSNLFASDTASKLE